MRPEVQCQPRVDRRPMGSRFTGHSVGMRDCSALLVRSSLLRK